MTQNELFRTAVKKAKSGKRQQAQKMLLTLVEADPQHELAWLWLSELVKEPEDKIIALENALTINPHRPQTNARLAKLRQKYNFTSAETSNYFSPNGNAPNIIHTQEEAHLAEIEQLFAAGKTTKASGALGDFLHRYSNNEAGWWLMVQHAEATTNLLTALDHVLRLNPHHPEAPRYLEPIKPTSEQCLQMGRLYERLEMWETAVRYYKRALKSPNNADRLLAKKRLPNAESQLKLANIKFTHPTTTVLRLAIGPTMLYAMLVFVQAGLNPLQTPPLLCIGNVAFLAGLLLLSGLSHTPHHPWLEKIQETAVLQNRFALRLFSLALVLLPIIVLILHTIFRLLAFELNLDAL
ncbi:tetratricopeptide repeat protein [Candidatus Leptofilum sp.]|uniref:tetratricopeptide repeat protein n=1 Tax=Candidatus Leptofilum sp. TaxID=3241576 RepID=UPI003B59C7A1